MRSPLMSFRAVASSTLGANVLLLGWAAIAVLALTCFFASIPAFFHQVRNLVGPALVDPFGSRMDPQRSRLALEALGWSAEGLAFGLTMLGAAFGFSYIGIGLYLFFHRPTERIALFLSLWLVTFGATFSPLAAAVDGQAPILGSLTVLLGNVAFASFLLLVVTFPDGRFIPGWSRWPALIAVSLVALGAALSDSAWHPSNWGIVGVFVQLGVFGTILYARIRRQRLERSEVRKRQGWWVMWSLLVSLFALIGSDLFTTYLLDARSPSAELLAQLFLAVVLTLSFMLVPVATAVSVLRYRLWDIDAILNRSLVYLFLTAVLVAIYAALVLGAGVLLQGGRAWASVLASATIAVLFAPLRDRLQRAVNRLMYGDRDDPYSLVAKLSGSLGLGLDPETVLPTVATTLKDALRLPFAAISISQDGAHIGAVAGDNPGRIQTLPLVHAGSEVGVLQLGLRDGQEAFSPQELRLFQHVAIQVSVAARAVLLYQESLRLARDLRESRERIVTAREEERRRLRRDLHDGLGPTLASQGLLLDAARNVMTRDPHGATRLLDDLARSMAGTVNEIRRVAHELRPPSLDELGLVGALEALPTRYSGNSLRVVVTAPRDLAPLPAAVEVAVLLIAGEALTNVVRHSGARNVELRLQFAPEEALVLEVADDGKGMPVRYESGVGLHSMRERAEEVGGHFQLSTSPAGGTLVRASFPLVEVD